MKKDLRDRFDFSINPVFSRALKEHQVILQGCYNEFMQYKQFGEMFILVDEEILRVSKLVEIQHKPIKNGRIITMEDSRLYLAGLISFSETLVFLMDQTRDQAKKIQDALERTHALKEKIIF